MDETRPTDAPGTDFAYGDLADRLRQATDLLGRVASDRRLLAVLSEEERQELLKAAGLVARPGPWAKRELAREVRKQRRQKVRAADEKRLAATGIRAKRRELVYQTPNYSTPPALPAPQGPVLKGERTCYVCKVKFTALHHFYDSMCPECAEFNFSKRQQSADLTGRVAIVTGGRVKIGYQTAIFLLRAGARVIVTTRFPRDAAARFVAEEDAEDWLGRLSVHGLDLRHTPSVEAFCQHMVRSEERLDVLINNACQTVRRPTGFYQHLMDGELGTLSALPAASRHVLASHEALREHKTLVRAEEMQKTVGWHHSAELSQLALVEEDLQVGEALFPSGRLDQDLQQVDLRHVNSWRLPLDQVSSVELLEVQLVNAVAPFVLNARLKPLMKRVETGDAHIVNVSAMEGQFYRSFKTDKHPHTNMAKAALNMMTRTSAVDYVQDGIHMNSVDTGWVSDEDPVAIAARKTEEHGFHPPLDIVDGAARIVDPVFSGHNSGEHQWGLFLKDYRPTPW